MGRLQEEPRVGDSVWFSENDKGMNGVVSYIDYANSTVFCSFEDECVTFDKDEFLGQLNERVNQWQIVR